jgi:hypothetical protein
MYGHGPGYAAWLPALPQPPAICAESLLQACGKI